jgi:hypothetical protein
MADQVTTYGRFCGRLIYAGLRRTTPDYAGLRWNHRNPAGIRPSESGDNQGSVHPDKKRRPEGRRRVYAQAVSGCRSAGITPRAERPQRVSKPSRWQQQQYRASSHRATPVFASWGVTQEENHHQPNNQFVHVYLRYHLLFRWFYHRPLTTRYP